VITSPAIYFVIGGNDSEWRTWRTAMLVSSNLERRVIDARKNAFTLRMNHDGSHVEYRWLPRQAWRRLIEGAETWGLIVIGTVLGTWSQEEIAELHELHESMWREAAH